MKFKHSLLFDRYPQLAPLKGEITQVIQVLEKSFTAGGKLLVMGNGGSSADAEHFCGELMKGFILPRPLRPNELALFKECKHLDGSILQGALPAMSLGVGHSLISAFSNDQDPQYIFAQQIWGLGNEDDVVFGISTSGNSKNVVLGLEAAKAKNIPTIALTGKQGGICSEIADITIKVPEEETFKAQELHLPIYHAICIELEFLFFDSGLK